jgi:hypothetical protein
LRRSIRKIVSKFLYAARPGPHEKDGCETSAFIGVQRVVWKGWRSQGADWNGRSTVQPLHEGVPSRKRRPDEASAKSVVLLSVLDGE